MAKLELDARQLAKRITLHAKVHHVNQWRWRLALAAWLIRLACWVAWLTPDVEIV